MKNWIKLVLPAMVLGMAVWSPAPVIDQKHGGSTKVETQADIEQQQKYNGKVDVQGSIVEDTTPDEIAKTKSDSTGDDVFNAASNQEEEAKAMQTMREAQKSIGQKSGGSQPWVWALVIGGLGFGSIMGARAWANKTIVVPEKQRKVRW